jgi:hypothetical protein
MNGCAGETPEPLTREIKTSSNHKLKIHAKKSYKKDESLQFSIDTGKTKGYVYLIYVDKKGGTALLSSKKTTKKKRSGKLRFPQDFGNKKIKVSKDCKSCKREKTTVYVLLSNDPIENINTMNKRDLLSLNTKQSLHKNRAISLEKDSKQKVIISKVEFFVE